MKSNYNYYKNYLDKIRNIWYTYNGIGEEFFMKTKRTFKSVQMDLISFLIPTFLISPFFIGDKMVQKKCKVCGKIFYCDKSVANVRKNCSTICQHKAASGKGAHNWGGGKHVDNKNRVMVLAPNHHRSQHKYIPEHIMVAEKALGKTFSNTHPVHHVNENRLDNCHTNLVICEDQKYHSLLHTRQDILKRGKNPRRYKICYTCNTVKKRTCFHFNKSRGDGLEFKCKICKNESIALYRRRKKMINNKKAEEEK